jgi:hypothetical protein
VQYFAWLWIRINILPGISSPSVASSEYSTALLLVQCCAVNIATAVQWMSGPSIEWYWLLLERYRGKVSLYSIGE